MSGNDIVIIGGGLEGCSIAYSLAKRGAGTITVLERDSVGSGGTGKSAGIVRCHYGVRQLASMALFSLPTFQNAEEILGASAGFEPVGYVVGVGAENVEPFTASVTSQQEIGVDTHFVDADFVAKLWPTAYLDDYAAFCYEPGAGYGDGYATAHAFANAARRLGVSIEQGKTVASIEASGEKVTGVALSDGTIVPADVVILVAGAWSVPLAGALGVELPIQPCLVQEVLIDPGQELGAPPVFSDLVSLQYVHMRNGEMLFGNSGEGFEVPIQYPDLAPSQASAEAIERVAEKATHRFPGIENPTVASTYTGVIDTTPDHNAIMSRTGYDGLFVAAGFSGHGYKISPAVGEFMSDLVMGLPSSIPHVDIDDFSLERFDAGKLLLSPFVYKGATGIR